MSEKLEDYDNVVPVKEYLTRNYKFARDLVSYEFFKHLTRMQWDVHFDNYSFCKDIKPTQKLLFPNVVKILEWSNNFISGSALIDYDLSKELVCSFIDLGLMNEYYDLYQQHKKEFHAYMLYYKYNFISNKQAEYVYRDIVSNKLFMPSAEAIKAFGNKQEINLKLISEDEYCNALCGGNSDDQIA